MSKVRLTAQSAPASTGGRSSKSGAPWPGDVLAALDEQLGRLRRQADPDAEAVRGLDDPQRAVLVDVGLGEDQLVGPNPRQHLVELVEPAEQRQAGRAGVGDRADEVVVDPAAGCAERPVQRRERLALPDEDHAPADAEVMQDIAGDRRVGSPEQADHQRGRRGRDRDEAGGREVVVRAETEREHEQRDQHQRRDDRARPGPPFARVVEPRLPEDEDGDRHEEGKPGLRTLPEQPPENRRVPVEELAEDERDVDAERQAEDVEPDECSDAEQATCE